MISFLIYIGIMVTREEPFHRSRCKIRVYKRNLCDDSVSKNGTNVTTFFAFCLQECVVYLIFVR